MNRSSRILILKGFVPLFCILVWTSCATSISVNKAIKSKDAEIQLQLADKLFAKKKYSYASTLYENVIPFFRNDPRYGDVIFKYGMCSYLQKDYTLAITIFDNLRNNVPNLPNKEKISYLIAESYALLGEPFFIEQTNNEHAISEAQQFISLHPKSVYVDSCLDIISKCRRVLEEKSYHNAQLYYNMGYYKAAQINFQSLILNFPDTQKSDMYEYYLIKSSEKVFASSIEEKEEERGVELLTIAENFLENYPSSKYANEVQSIQGQVQEKLKKIKSKSNS